MFKGGKGPSKTSSELSFLLWAQTRKKWRNEPRVHCICISKTPQTSQAMTAVGTSSTKDKAIMRRCRQGHHFIHDLRGSRGGASLARVGGVHEQRKSEREWNLLKVEMQFVSP